MEYKFFFKDGSEALVHHGVKGMHWGEWNQETKEKYGIVDDDGGLSKLKAFRETSYTLPAGTPISRFSGVKEAQNASTLDKPYFYGSHNEKDFDTYAQEVARGKIPSATKYKDGKFSPFGGEIPEEAGLIRMSNVDDMTIARGKFVVGEIIREFMPKDEDGQPLDFPAYKDFTSPQVHEHFRKMGYDAIEDPEDQRFAKVATHPLIVLNPDKMHIDSAETYSVKNPPKWRRY